MLEVRLGLRQGLVSDRLNSKASGKLLKDFKQMITQECTWPQQLRRYQLCLGRNWG